jgi:actin-like ATPase involved in cell morphogenesis
MLRRPDGRVTPLLFDGTPVLPSAVFASTDGTLSVGGDAVHHGRHRPDGLEPNPKRRIDEGTVLLGSSAYPLADVVGAVLRRVGHEATRVAGQRPDVLVLSHPAGWGPVRRLTLSDAAAAGGLPAPAFVAEPVAAALYFTSVLGGAVPAGTALIVYDFGAGTFDVTVLGAGESFEVLGSDGLDDVGGLDIDAALIGWLRPRYDAAAWERLTRPATVEDRRLRHDLCREARVTKEMLSRSPAVLMRPPLLDGEIPLTLEEFEGIVQPLVDRTVRTTLGLARYCEVAAPRVLLVGGSSRIPLVATALHRAFGLPPTVTEQPETVVAEGCVFAAVARPGAGDSPSARSGHGDSGGRAGAAGGGGAAGAGVGGLAGALAAGLAWPTQPPVPAQRDPWTGDGTQSAEIPARAEFAQPAMPAQGPPVRMSGAPTTPPGATGGHPAASTVERQPVPGASGAAHDDPASERTMPIGPASRDSGGPVHDRAEHPGAAGWWLVPQQPNRAASAGVDGSRGPSDSRDRDVPGRMPAGPAGIRPGRPDDPGQPAPGTRRNRGSRVVFVLFGFLSLLVAAAAVLALVKIIPLGDDGGGHQDPVPQSVSGPSYPAWSVQYTDPLASPSGWSATAEPQVSAECVFRNNRLEIDMKIGGIFRCPGQRGNLTDFALRLDVYLIDGQTCAGIWFRRGTHEAGQDSGYLLKVCPKELALGYHHSGGKIVDFKRIAIPKIAPNTRAAVGLVVQGSDIRLYLAERFIGRHGDTVYANGRIALGIAVPKEIGAGRIGFGNIELRTP